MFTFLIIYLVFYSTVITKWNNLLDCPHYFLPMLRMRKNMILALTNYEHPKNLYFENRLLTSHEIYYEFIFFLEFYNGIFTNFELLMYDEFK